MRFEVEIKHGRHWIPVAIFRSSCSRSAALRASYVYNRKVIRVRPEDSRDKWLVYRFQYVASLACGV